MITGKNLGKITFAEYGTLEDIMKRNSFDFS